jgi:hypothetical protein
MMQQEVNGLIFTADDRVPADFFIETIKGFSYEDIQDIKEEEGFVYDLTELWNNYMIELKDQIDFVFEPECKSVKEYLKKYINENY